MNTKYLAVFLTLLFLVVVPALAAPPNTPTLDGRPYEYDAGELRGTNTAPPHEGANNVITNLYVTWDTNALYVMLQGWESDRKLAVLIDVDPGNGTGATTTTNWAGTGNGYINWNGVGWVAGAGAPFGLDYMLASEGEYNNVLRVLYDGSKTPSASDVIAVFDHGNGNRPEGSPVDMVIQADGTECVLKGFEVRIPWTDLYSDNRFGTPGPGGVPVGASLRLFANLHNNSDASVYSYSNAIPVQAAGSWNEGTLTTEAYLDVVVDGDNDGLPDVAPGDVNAPFISNVSGGAGSTAVFVSFNEATTPGTAGVAANYLVDGFSPSVANVVSPTLVQLDLSSALPGEGSLVMVHSTGIQDASGNAKANDFCLAVGPAGISSPVSVTFVLDTYSGMGASHTLGGVFLNSDTLPLEEGFPPSTSTPLAPASGDFYSTTVVFPAGTPADVGYRYSGLLPNGTNNYEAIRLDNYAYEKRWLTLDDSMAGMVVTDYLGAAASPLRQGDTGYDELYADSRRGDAGVRERTTVLFQLDLSQRYLGEVTRVLLLGMDPLRGFNSSDQPVADWPGDPLVGWDVGGIEMFDDGPTGGHGDLVLTDGVYSVTWAATADGYDTTLVPDMPNALVGGDYSTDPYAGTAFWENRRSPRSFALKYAVVVDGEGILSPGSNIDFYIQDADGTDIAFAPFVWDNNDLPRLTAAFPAEIVDVIPDGADTKVVYTNIKQAPDNTVEMAADPTGEWMNYGLQGDGADNVYTATVTGVTDDTQVFRIRTPGHSRTPTYWEPHPAASGQVVTVYFNQNGTSLAGNQDVKFSSNLNGWSTDSTPMNFVSNGLWTYSFVAIPDGARQGVYWKVNPGWVGNSGGGDFTVITDNQGVTWSPPRPLAGGPVTITYDGTGGPLEDVAGVRIHWWVDGLDAIPGGSGGTGWPGDTMTSNAPNEWVYTLTVPANAERTVNFLFNDLDNENNKDENYGGNRNYNLFLGP